MHQHGPAGRSEAVSDLSIALVLSGVILAILVALVIAVRPREHIRLSDIVDVKVEMSPVKIGPVPGDMLLIVGSAPRMRPATPEDEPTEAESHAAERFFADRETAKRTCSLCGRASCPGPNIECAKYQWIADREGKA
jgi:hypothetical protein